MPVLINAFTRHFLEAQTRRPAYSSKKLNSGANQASDFRHCRLGQEFSSGTQAAITDRRTRSRSGHSARGYGGRITDLSEGRGGTRLMRSVTTIADEQQPDAFLQTGRAEDVELCERFGFRVTQEATFDGEPVWAMLRLYSATVHRTETDGTRQHPSPASQCARLHGPGIFS